MTKPFSSIPGLTGIRGTSDKECNKMRLGGSGEVVEAPCSGNSALVVCGGKFLYLLESFDKILAYTST